MEIKQYHLFKTAKKTAQENHLIIAENNIATTKTLFDFSELNNTDLPEWEKEVIKADALKTVCAFNRESFYGAEYNDFISCSGIATFIPHKVYDRASGRHLYNIMQLVSVYNNHTERKSIYDDWKTTKTEYRGLYGEPLDDLEI